MIGATQTSTWQHSILTTDRHLCPRQDLFIYVLSLYFSRTSLSWLSRLLPLLYNKHNTNIRAPRQDSNPQSQPASGHKPTRLIARPPASANPQYRQAIGGRASHICARLGHWNRQSDILVFRRGRVEAKIRVGVLVTWNCNSWKSSYHVELFPSLFIYWYLWHSWHWLSDNKDVPSSC